MAAAITDDVLCLFGRFITSNSPFLGLYSEIQTINGHVKIFDTSFRMKCFEFSDPSAAERKVEYQRLTQMLHDNKDISLQNLISFMCDTASGN